MSVKLSQKLRYYEIELMKHLNLKIGVVLHLWLRNRSQVNYISRHWYESAHLPSIPHTHSLGINLTLTLARYSFLNERFMNWSERRAAVLLFRASSSNPDV